MMLGRTLAAAFGAALAIAGPALAATYDLRDAEIISVSGSRMIVRDGNSAAAYTVGGGATFTVDGASTPLSSLKPGMRITGPVVTAAPPVAMSLVELRDSTVAYTMGGNLIVSGDQPKEYRHFSGAETGEGSVLIYRNGVLVAPTSLVPGDRITAAVVTKLPPKDLSEDDLQEFLESARRKPGTLRSIANTPRVDRSAAKALMADTSASNAPAPTSAPDPAAAATAPTPSAAPSAPASPPHVTAPPPRSALATAPAPTPPASAPSVAPAPTSSARPKQLPKTASARPAVALAGIVLAGLGAILTLGRRAGGKA